MSNISILTSILDNDFYKFTMQQAVIKLFPYAKATFSFINRGKHEFPENFANLLQNEVQKMSKLKLTPDEKLWLQKTCPYLDPTYLDFIQGYRYDPTEVTITQNGSELNVHIEGLWYRTILWEVPLMSLICELYYTSKGLERNSDGWIVENTRNKINSYSDLGIKVAEFGTRRRHSSKVHNLVVETLEKYGNDTFVGTSNVHLAMLHNTKPIGTHAHEWFMFHAAKYGYKMANLMGLQHWVEVYRGDLGIALTDTYTTDVFFEHFDKMFAKLFDGVRHDSGDPLEFTDKTIRHYEKLGIDPLTKHIIFSDGLNFDKVKKIEEHAKGKIQTSYGIGTNFTNDVGLPSMNIVIKMQKTLPHQSYWTDVVKLSDEKNKHTGTPESIELAQRNLLRNF